MTILEQLEIPPLDALAFGWFALSTLGYKLLTRLPVLERHSLIGAVHHQRVQWMMNMAARPDRFIDVMVLGNLATGHSFFASTSVLLVGALTALLGSGETALAFLGHLPFADQASLQLWPLKVLFVIAIFIYAFFKFGWSFRLAHYAMIMVGATPAAGAANAAACREHAERTARLAGLAAEHSNAGLRSYYFAIAALGWLFHPLLFVAATTWVMLIVIRREYFSRSVRAIAGR